MAYQQRELPSISVMAIAFKQHWPMNVTSVGSARFILLLLLLLYAIGFVIINNTFIWISFENRIKTAI